MEKTRCAVPSLAMACETTVAALSGRSLLLREVNGTTEGFEKVFKGGVGGVGRAVRIHLHLTLKKQNGKRKEKQGMAGVPSDTRQDMNEKHCHYARKTSLHTPLPTL